jgi:hypothetical protein
MLQMQTNELKYMLINHNYFKSAVGFFSFFSSTNVETKNVCPIAYNGWVYVLYAKPQTLKLSTTLIWRITYIPCYAPLNL